MLLRKMSAPSATARCKSNESRLLRLMAMNGGKRLWRQVSVEWDIQNFSGPGGDLYACYVFGVGGNLIGDAEHIEKIPASWIDTIAANLFARKRRFIAKEHANSLSREKRCTRCPRRSGSYNHNIKTGIVQRSHWLYLPNTRAALIPPNPNELERI